MNRQGTNAQTMAIMAAVIVILVVLVLWLTFK
jgi:hypothetical protein